MQVCTKQKYALQELSSQITYVPKEIYLNIDIPKYRYIININNG